MTFPHTLHEALSLVSSGAMTVEKILEGLFATIEEKEGDVRAYLSLADASELCEEARRKADLPLGGLPIAVKDNISVLGFPLACGSRFLECFFPVFEATAVERLRAAGATILGKTNLDEFAMGSSTENSAFFPTGNPWDRERVPGGSSGGSAAAVAASEALAALGSDTGGSVRQPASLCGVVGLRPTYGLVSRYGLVAFASSLDQIGVLTQDVEDAALLLEVIAGHDPRDATSLPVRPDRYRESLHEGIKGMRIGVPREAFPWDLSPEARERIASWEEVACDLGAEVVPVLLPHARYALPTYHLVACSEASANLARFDGVRYTSIAQGATIGEVFAESRTRGFGEEVRRRVLLGTYALSAGYYEKFYGKAQRVRRLIAEDFERTFRSVGLLLSPTSPTPAFRFGEKDDPLAMYRADVFTLPASLAGLPAISIPGGEVDSLPYGLELVAPRLGERALLRGAAALERALS